MAKRYREVVADADIVSLEAVGHWWPQIEAPHSVLAAALPFLGRTSPA